MRLSALAVIAAYAALTHVSAAPTPLRLLVVSSSIEEDSPLNGIRFGHAVQPMPPYRQDNSDREVLPPAKEDPFSPTGNPPKRFRHRPGCHGKKGKVAIFMQKVKIKAIKIGNCFRKALGWPLIEVNHHHHHHHGPRHRHGHHHPKPGKDEKKVEAAGRIHVGGGFVSILPFPGWTTDNHRDWAGASHDRPHHHKLRGSFLSRLHHSLMNLGRWEGRAVAFVIGCGIGVLIRMFWVLAIVSYRACRGSRDDGYVTVAVMEEYDSDDEIVISAPSPKVHPPKYIYPVDEKIAIEESN